MDALGFMRSQTRLIKNRVYALRYPDVDFAMFVPVSEPTMGAGQWATGIEHYSSDISGRMTQISPDTTELPMIQLTHSQHLVRAAEFGGSIGFNWFETQQAMLVGDTSMTANKEAALRRTYDETHWDIVMNGRSAMGWDGLLNNTNVTATDATGVWSGRDADAILSDINTQIEGVFLATNTVDLADTMYLPPGVHSTLSSKFIDGTSESVMNMIQRSNVYTTMTGRPLTVRVLRGLENAAAGNANRAIFFRNQMDVLEYHLIMPLTFYDLWRTGPFSYALPAITRTAGLEIKLPSSVRYLDLI